MEIQKIQLSETFSFLNLPCYKFSFSSYLISIKKNIYYYLKNKYEVKPTIMG